MARSTKKETLKGVQPEHYNGRDVVDTSVLEHVSACSDCKKLYGQMLSGWEHPKPKG